MDERKLSDEFNRRWKDGAVSPDDKTSDAVQEALQTARMLAQANFSGESRKREEIRRRLLAQIPEESQTLARKEVASNALPLSLRYAVYLAVGLAFILGLTWVIRNVLPGGAPLSQLPAAAPLEVTGTPLPTLTPFPPPENYTPLAAQTYTIQPGDTWESIAARYKLSLDELLRLNGLNAVIELQPGMVILLGYVAPDLVTPTPPVLLPPGYLNLQSLPGEIIQRMTYPYWDTLWLEGEARYRLADGSTQKMIVQAWLARDGRGHILSTGRLPGETEFNAYTLPGLAWVSDGQSITTFDYTSQTLTSTSLPGFWAYHPLESTDPLMGMIFPAQPLPPGESLLPRELAVFLDRPVLVADWETTRYWIDAETGLVLRRQADPAGGDEIFEVELRQVVFNPALPPGVFDTTELSGQTFNTPPILAANLPPTPTSTPQPIPVLPVESPAHVSLVPQDGLQLVVEGDELYLLMTGASAPFERRFVRLQASCLYSEATCPAYWMPTLPSQVQATLYWSSGGQQALLMDTNNGKLVAFDPQSIAWRTLLPDFYASKEPVIWSPDQAWVAFSLQAPDGNGSLASIARPDGTQLHSLVPDLGGQQEVLGWLANNHLLFLRSYRPPKGQVGITEPPSLYSIDIETGQYTLLPFQADWLLAKSYPAPSPDGKRIALTQPGSSGAELVIADSEGQILQRLGVDGGSPLWSPDGQWLAFVVSGGTGTVVYVARPDGSEMKSVFQASIYPPMLWAPDSLHLLVEDYVQNSPDDPGYREISLISIPDGAARLLTIQGSGAGYEMTNPSFRAIPIQ